ncbi:hypothetical protein KUTeg_010861 [Tegillarca granosa]|uniref:Uncharacterized protein n=1 Tax=Tegillarca granosa TaxID=220873 RepID=A0ABQ9F4J7_TEGGR|nr:hypothetical protein KUTeg_010861 [Tegillarca granosa]
MSQSSEVDIFASKASMLLRGAGVIVKGSNIVKCMSFALHSYTNWRNQVRLKSCLYRELVHIWSV